MARSSSDAAQLSRRDVLKRSALAVAGAAAFSSPLEAALAADANAQLRLSQPTRGSAGAVWRPLFERRGPNPIPGLDLRWIGGDPGQEMVQLLAGALDVSIVGPIGAAESALKGGKIAIIAPGLNNHGFWIVRRDSPYKSFKDLRGKRIATIAATSETYRQARLASALDGFDLKTEIEIIHGPPTANVALFERGDVEGLIAIEPVATRLIARGARELTSVEEMWRQATGDAAPMLLGGQTVRRDWVEQNPAQAAALAALYRSVNAEINAKPELLAELHAELGIPATERDAIELLPKRLPKFFPSAWGAPVFAAIDHMIDVAVKGSVLAGVPPQKIYVDPRPPSRG